MGPLTAFARTIIVLDQASGTARLDDDHVVGVDLHPVLDGWLEEQAASGAATVLALRGTAEGGPTGSISDRGDQGNDEVDREDWLAAAAGVTQVITLDHGSPSDDASALTDLAAELDGTTAFVCADRSRRGQARAAGFVPVAHPAILPLLTGAEAPVIARFAGPRSLLERLANAHGIVPMHFQPVPDSPDWALIGIGPTGRR